MGSIRIEAVSFAYADSAASKSGNAHNVIEDLSLVVPSGQFLCVIGHSGGGKSTLLRLIAGLSQPSAGRIMIDGKEVHEPGMDRAIVFQDYSLFPWMRVKDNVEFGIEQANRKLGRGLSKCAISDLADEYLSSVSMTEAQDKYPYQLSGGMQQRVAIARALAMDTEIVLFDEPFGALDVKTRRHLQSLVDELWTAGERRKTAVFITHDISEAILLADRVVFLAEGRITADFEVDLPRPRTAEFIASDLRAREIGQYLTDLFYESGGDPDQDEGDGCLRAVGNQAEELSW